MLQLILLLSVISLTAADPVSAVSGLVTRLLGPSELSKFSFEVIPKDPAGDVYELDYSSSTNQVVIRGNDGVSLSTGLNNYLKYTLNVSISWGRNNSGVLAIMPPTLPPPATPGRTVFPAIYRYSWNVCTPGYSFVWYSWEQWQFMIDWMALNGVNLPLAFTGQEAVLSQVFSSLGLTDAEIWAYLSGPAFLPWNRMGNMQAWGALYSEVNGLDWGWMTSQYNLQLQIVGAMREFGMVPVLPGFAGHVPRAMERLYPNAQFTRSSDWCGFNDTFGSVTLLEPSDPTFVVVGTAVNKAILKAFGDPTGLEVPVFNSDTFNEMEPNNASLAYLAACNANVYAAMVAADPRAIYMMQGWLFLEGFWTYERTQAYLGSVPIGSMLILDLYSDGSPQWDKYDSYFGHHWIWNSLIVFGGRRGIYGTLPSLASSPYIDRTKNASLVGIGVTPEAIDMSQPMFDVTLEAGWRTTAPEPHAWLQSYAVRRYGKYSPTISQAYDALYDAAYDNKDIDESIIEDMPTNTRSGSRNTNATGILAALRLFHAALAGGEADPTTGPASYDLTDFTRQFICNLFQDVHDVYSSRLSGGGDLEEVTSITTTLLGLLTDLDMVNSGDQNFLLGTWLEDAAQWGFNASQKANRVFNAKNQITLWGPNGEINDYAAKVGWSGLVSSYYLTRWTSLFDVTLSALALGTAPDLDAWGREILAWEQRWSVDPTMFPTTPSGTPPLATTGAMLAKYGSRDPVGEGYTVSPGFDTVERPPGPPIWGKIPGSDGMVAVGDDCPWIQKGDGSSLAACEASCDANDQCNAVNFSPSITDCELRLCSNPSNPSLSGYPGGWAVYTNTAKGKAQVITHAWHTDVAVLTYLCDLTPACAGFTSAGKLTTNATVVVATPGVTTYAKKGTGGGMVEVVRGGAPLPRVEGEGEGVGVVQAGGMRPRGKGKNGLPLPPLSPAKRMRAAKRASKV